METISVEMGVPEIVNLKRVIFALILEMGQVLVLKPVEMEEE